MSDRNHVDKKVLEMVRLSVCDGTSSAVHWQTHGHNWLTKKASAVLKAVEDKMTWCNRFDECRYCPAHTDEGCEFRVIRRAYKERS